MRGFPFQVEADGVICYTGVFTTCYSSIPIPQACAVIDFGVVRKENHLPITLNYATKRKGNDPRADPRVRSALTALEKLRQ
jgi:hypothetical protein